MFTSILDTPLVSILLILAFFSLIGLIAYTIQKNVPFFKQNQEKVDPETAAREEVERVIVKLDEPLKPKPLTASGKVKKVSAKKTAPKKHVKTDQK